MSQGIGSWLACHDFEQNTTADPPSREAMHDKLIESPSILLLLEVSEELGIAQVSSPGFGNDSKMMVMPVRCVPLTTTHCRLRLTWNREHALWTPQQWSCVMFFDKSGFSLPSDSRRTLIWRVLGTRYHQENTIE
ncbi:transposable element Tcb2 transposase [Trichonephila clavipes]|nr:transposable element Tcb2 transposase [Trichonephila clavipes]